MKTKVRDVMTSPAVVISADASFKQAAEKLIAARVAGLPVVDDDHRVVGVVSESDLITKEDREHLESVPRVFQHRRTRAARAKLDGRTVAGVMTRPPICVEADAPVATAARLMCDAGVRRLPVVDADGHVLGVVARADLLKVFLRSDEQLLVEVQNLITERVWIDPRQIQVAVNGGVVTLNGQVDLRSQAQDLEELTTLLDGVVSVDTRLSFATDDLAPTYFPM